MRGGRPDGTVDATSSQSTPPAHSRRHQLTVDATSSQSTISVNPPADAWSSLCGGTSASSDQGRPGAGYGVTMLKAGLG
ncbi:hypothetical protein PJI17_04085 [Mycobacterium kansasii]